MANAPEPLRHSDVEKKEDEVLVQEAHAFLSKAPSLQLVAELLGELRTKALPWWAPEGLRVRYNASERLRWLRDRPDLRQQITTQVTGLVPKAARKKAPDFQASLIDSAVEDGDCSVRAFEDAFAPTDLAIYGPAADFWRQFRLRMPWAQETPVHQELVAFVLKALLAEKGVDKGTQGFTRKPILTPWDVRTALPGKVWHTRMPLDVRVAIDDARFERERTRPRDPFHARDDLALALPEIIAAHLPLKDFTRVLDAAEKAMGMEGSVPDVAMASMTPPPAAAVVTGVTPPAGVPTVSPSPSGGAFGAGRESRQPPPPPMRPPSISSSVTPPVPASPPPFPAAPVTPGTAASPASPGTEEADVLFDVEMSSEDVTRKV